VEESEAASFRVPNVDGARCDRNVVAVIVNVRYKVAGVTISEQKLENWHKFSS